VPANPFVIEGANDSFGIVRTTVADHDQLKITKCLPSTDVTALRRTLLQL
jgi:hypothetical protein